MARAVTRLSLGRGGPRDLCCLRDSLAAATAVPRLFAETVEPLDPCPPRNRRVLSTRWR